MDIRVEIDSAEARKALADFPGVMGSNVDLYLLRAAGEVAREAKIAAPGDLSALKDSIRSIKDGHLAYVVAPGVQYGAAVEYGTGPAAGKASYFPNRLALLDYINTPSRRGFKLAKKGSGKRQGQVDELQARSWALARYIFAHGTKPHPYMAPTAEKMRPRVEALVKEGVEAGIREAFGS
ncbi:MAG: hypothetical protein KKH74_01705 [Gammaproteobacteria bacterium]|nr:hypothetical protein [Gammaproteobacteria bacterium]MBU1731042.1 hypothetical protein [Gammaproteobacteria bacterium]MBU1893702.1 hypothetical protein [Gammaproteobacteria bacterium]